jgi:hypothetical protein
VSNEPKSLADRAVETLVAVRAMDAGVALEHPERHAVRELKSTAEAIIEQALRQAARLAESAHDLRKLHRQIETGVRAER